MGMADPYPNNPLHEQIAELRLKNHELEKRVSEYFKDLVAQQTRIGALEDKAAQSSAVRMNRIEGLEGRLVSLEKDALKVERLHRDRIDALELNLAAKIDNEIEELEQAAESPTAPAADLAKVVELSKKVDEGLAWIDTARRVFQPVLDAFQRAPLDGQQIASRKIVDDQLALLARTLRTEMNDKITAKLSEAADLARTLIARLGPADPRDSTGASAAPHLEVSRKIWMLWDRGAVRMEAEKKPGRLESFLYAVTGTRR